MSLFPCSACRLRVPGKYANVTIAWWTQANVRIAYRLRVCTTCYGAQIARHVGLDDAEVLICPMCGSASADDLDPVFFTIYIPQYGKVQAESPTCASCAAHFRIWAQENGAQLENLSGGQGPGPQTQTPDVSEWVKLGLVPRDTAE